MAGEDVRFQASRWVSSNVVDGSSIGIDAELQLFPLDYSRCAVVSDRIERLSTERFDVVVLTTPKDELAEDLVVHLENGSRLSGLRFGKSPDWDSFLPTHVWIYTR